MTLSGKNAPAARQAREISLVVACRNEAKHIRLFLDSLLAQDMEGFDWQIVVADGASDDGTRQVLEEYAKGNPRITVIDNPAKIVSCGLNAAIRAARGSIILRMDAHTEYAPHYVQRCVEALHNSGADNVGGPARTKADGLLPRAIEAAYHSRFSTGGARFHDDNHSGYVDTVPYGCWRKETLLRLGLFDEELVRNQDDELNLRLTRSGGKIWQSAEIVSWYRPRTNLSSLFRQYFQYGFWKVRVIRKHRIPGSWRHLIPGLFVGANLSLLIASACAALAGSPALGRALLLSWAALFAAYALAALAASFMAARRCGWSLLPYLPVTFAVFHCSYGLGFLLGSVYWTFAKKPQSRLGDFFVGVTR
jgi:succinoglycan biosynthesis protein ExoA